MKLSYDKLETYSIMYVYLGIILFLGGWIRLTISLPCILFFLYILYQRYFKLQKPSSTYIVINEKILFLIILGICLWLIASGIGGFCRQSGDWDKHNAILHDLITYRWPVSYVLDNNKEALLSYYLASYLFPALVGKIFGFRCAEIVLLLQSIFGVVLVYLHICYFLKIDKTKNQIFAFILLVFFGGNILLGKRLYGYFRPDDLHSSFHWFSNIVRIQYSSHIVLIRWVFPQCIIPWMVTLLFLENPYKTENFAWIGIPVFMYSCFAFVGLIPFFVGASLYKLYQDKNIIKWLKRIFSLPNIYALFFIMPILFFYISGNVLQEKPDIVGFHVINYSGNWSLYLIFCFSNFLLWSIWIWKQEVYNPIFYIANIILLCLPLFWYGTWNDLCMRTCIPAFFVIAILLFKYILKVQMRKGIDKVMIIFCICLLFFSAIPQTEELINNAKYFSLSGSYRADKWMTLSKQLVRDGTNDSIAYNYVAYNCENTFFVKYLSR